MQNRPSTSSVIPSRHHLRHRRRRRHSVNPYRYFQSGFTLTEAPRITLGIRTQEDLECVVGKDITSEHPWKYVSKEAIKDNLIFQEESEFLPLRLDILTYPRDRLLLAYVPDETRQEDEFIVCLNEKTEDKVAENIAAFMRAVKAAVTLALYRNPRSWRSLGSEAEIEEYTDRTNRDFLTVEVEAAYPLMSPKVRFRFRYAEDVRDGYVELIQARSFRVIISKMRIHAAVQVTPHVADCATQTLCKYPKSAATQYVLEFSNIETISSEVKKSIVSFMSSGLDFLCEQMSVNAGINLYTNDYLRLFNDYLYAKQEKRSKAEVLMTFSDLSVSKDKLIAAVCWHPILSGTVAIAYSEMASNVIRTGKTKSNEIKTWLPKKATVLVWCTNDELHPKLRLECSSEVTYLSFCPHDETIIVGACANGQIVVWDIGDKLDQAEKTNIYTDNEKKFKIFMSSFMTWMKDVQDRTRVPVAVESDLAYSHGEVAVSIQWLPPYCRVTQVGKYEMIGEGEPNTMQFATCSLDGTIFFWDLLSNPRTLRQNSFLTNLTIKTKIRPNALKFDKSPYKHLNRVFRPHYKLVAVNSKKERPLLISSMVFPPLNISYDKPSSREKLNFTDRVAHTVRITRPAFDVVKADIFCGTCHGYVFRATWEGHEVDQGYVVSAETLVTVSIGRYHDGPVTCIERHPDFTDTYLTVGGNVFAVWKDSLKHKPIFWRKSRHRYLHGEWDSRTHPSIRLCTDDGRTEKWIISRRQDKFLYDRTLSGRMVLSAYMHPFTCNDKEILGIADSDGTFRIVLSPRNLKDICYLRDNLRVLLNKEVRRKNDFIKWQNSWSEKHQEVIQEMNAKINIYRQQKLEKERREMEKREEELRKEEERKLLQKRKLKPIPGQHLKIVRAQCRVREQEHMRSVLLTRQRLNPELLEKSRRPLKLAQEEEEKIQRKLKERLRDADKIFHDTVAMLFPDVLKKEPPPPLDPYAGGDTLAVKQQCLFEYVAISEKADQDIKSSPYEYNYNWKATLQSAKDRFRSYMSVNMRSHKDRFLREKKKLANNT